MNCLSYHRFAANAVRPQLFARAYNLGTFQRRLAPSRSTSHGSLRTFRKKKGVAKIPDTARTPDAKGKARHGDAGFALALAHYASRQDGVEYGYQAAKPVDKDGDPLPRDVRVTAGWGRREGAW